MYVTHVATLEYMKEVGMARNEPYIAGPVSLVAMDEPVEREEVTLFGFTAIRVVDGGSYKWYVREVRQDGEEDIYDEIDTFAMAQDLLSLYGIMVGDVRRAGLEGPDWELRLSPPVAAMLMFYSFIEHDPRQIMHGLTTSGKQWVSFPASVAIWASFPVRKTVVSPAFVGMSFAVLDSER